MIIISTSCLCIAILQRCVLITRKNLTMVIARNVGENQNASPIRQLLLLLTNIVIQSVLNVIKLATYFQTFVLMIGRNLMKKDIVLFVEKNQLVRNIPLLFMYSTNIVIQRVLTVF